MSRFERHNMTDRRDAIRNKISSNKFNCKFAVLDDDKRIEVLKLSAQFVCKKLTELVNDPDQSADYFDKFLNSQSMAYRSRPFDNITTYYDRFYIVNNTLEILLYRLIKEEKDEC